jgi:hypothetical protein
VRQRIANAGDAFLTEAGHHCESTIMRCGFEIRQRLEPELVMKPFRQDASNARHGCKQGYRIRFSAQSVEQRKAAVGEELTNGARDALTDARKGLQSRESL